MATPREIFDKDNSGYLSVQNDFEIKNGAGITASVTVRVSLDINAGVRYVSIYIDDCPLAVSAIAHYIRNPNDALRVAEGIEIITGFHGTSEKIPSSTMKFSGRMFAYTAARLSQGEKDEVEKLATQNGILLVIRDGHYIAQRILMQSPLAFISHDSRDKEKFVRELASTLQKMLCTVWYDEFSLIPGASLRESIETGLKKCKKCVLILSPNFIGNGGWTKAEFDSIFTREILEKKNVVIPIWHGVTKEEVYEYCPRLLDRVALQSEIGVEEVARKLVVAINYEG
jgi:hypothetical protein